MKKQKLTRAPRDCPCVQVDGYEKKEKRSSSAVRKVGYMDNN